MDVSTAIQPFLKKSVRMKGFPSALTMGPPEIEASRASQKK